VARFIEAQDKLLSLVRGEEKRHLADYDPNRPRDLCDLFKRTWDKEPHDLKVTLDPLQYQPPRQQHDVDHDSDNKKSMIGYKSELVFEFLVFKGKS